MITNPRPSRASRHAGAMTATFLLVYVLTPFPFAWLLGTSSARVVIVPALSSQP